MNSKNKLLVLLLIAAFIIGSVGAIGAASAKTSSNGKLTKATLKVSAPAVTNVYKKSQTFKVTVKDKKTGKAMKGVKVTIKVYTGKKYKTYQVKTNGKGVASINTKSLSKANHKVLINIKGNKKYKGASAKSSIKISKAKDSSSSSNAGQGASSTGSNTAQNEKLQTKITVEECSISSGGYDYKISLKDSKGNKLANKDIEINTIGSAPAIDFVGPVNQTVVKTNSEGIAQGHIEGKVVQMFRQHSYDITFTFAGDDSYYSSTASKHLDAS